MGLFRHLPRAWPLAAALTIASVFQPAAAADQDQQAPTQYICQVTKQGPYGQVWYELDVPAEGGAAFHRLNWEIKPRGEGISVGAQWVGWHGASDSNHLDGNTPVNIYFYIFHQPKDKVRIEIRRSDKTRYPGEMSYAGLFARPYRLAETPLYYVETSTRWDDIINQMNDRDALIFALVQPDGTVVAQDRLTAATIAGAVSELAALRPEAEAMAADFRHSCRPVGDIIVTGASR
jgi:hypothetical protein